MARSKEISNALQTRPTNSIPQNCDKMESKKARVSSTMEALISDENNCSLKLNNVRAKSFCLEGTPCSSCSVHIPLQTRAARSILTPSRAICYALERAVFQAGRTSQQATTTALFYSSNKQQSTC